MTQRDTASSDETRQQPDDAVAMLTAEHCQVRALLQQYAETSDPYLQQIIAEHIFAELTLHMLLEETVLYPVFAEQTDEEGKRLVREALQDHQQLRDLMQTLAETDNNAVFAAAFQTLRDQVEQHFADEEATLFPQAAQILATHWEEITILLQERRAQILAS